MAGVSDRVAREPTAKLRGSRVASLVAVRSVLKTCSSSATPSSYQVPVHSFLDRRRPSCSLMPPHTPWFCLVSSAKPRHCRRTGQPASGAVMYAHQSGNWPARIIGAIARAGLTPAPMTGPTITMATARARRWPWRRRPDRRPPSRQGARSRSGRAQTRVCPPGRRHGNGARGAAARRRGRSERAPGCGRRGRHIARTPFPNSALRPPSRASAANLPSSGSRSLSGKNRSSSATEPTSAVQAPNCVTRSHVPSRRSGVPTRVTTRTRQPPEAR
jgi:hypothetical protein